MNLIWKIKLKTIKTLIKKQKKKQKWKEKGSNWNYYYSHWKNKNYKHDFKEKIENHINFDKRAKEKKINRRNESKKIYMKIRIEILY
jgi:hypothetical protein